MLQIDLKWYSKRSGADTKGFEFFEFSFKMAFLKLNAVLCPLGKYICHEQNNRKIPLALFSHLEYNFCFISIQIIIIVLVKIKKTLFIFLHY